MRRRSPVGPFLRLNNWIWNSVPPSVAELSAVRSCGRLLHAVVRRWEGRRQYFGTYFLRNRPQLELIRRLTYEAESESPASIGVLGCSNGAEVYSILATLRMVRPEVKVVLHAVDISEEVLEIAKKGTYSLGCRELVDEPIFQRMSAAEMQQMFDQDTDTVTVKSWISEGIIWHHGDVCDPGMSELVGPQDLVIANNFLCHMRPPEAETCLRGIVRLVKPGGHLIVSGIDLDVRTKVASDQKWKPVTELLEEIHDADSLRRDWPKRYWGLEPLDKNRKNWIIRYATAFQIGEKSLRENINSTQSGGKVPIPQV